jgi:hypothetical protein
LPIEHGVSASAPYSDARKQVGREVLLPYSLDEAGRDS